MDKAEKGRLGEDTVCRELIKNGHKIICRNFHKACGEIDIISQKDECIVFTEVKTRRSGSMVSGVEAVNFRKQKRIVLTADAYLNEHHVLLQPRYDIAEVTITAGGTPVVTNVQLYENAFAADGIYTLY